MGGIQPQHVDSLQWTASMVQGYAVQLLPANISDNENHVGGRGKEVGARGHRQSADVRQISVPSLQ